MRGLPTAASLDGTLGQGVLAITARGWIRRRRQAAAISLRSGRRRLVPAGAVILATLALGIATAYGGFASFKKPRTFPVGNNPRGIAAGDFDRDGDPDLAVTNFSPPLSITILKNRGRARFKPSQTIPLSAQPDDITVAPHLNGDRDLDLVAGTLNGGIVTLRGADGTHFDAPEVIPDANGPREVAAADFNRDGLTDVAADRQDTNDVAVYLNTGAGFGSPDLYSPGGGGEDISAGRINGDRRPDLIVPSFAHKAIYVYPGRADGTFGQPLASPGGASPEAAVRGSFNRDRKPDLAVADPDPTESGGIGRIAILLGRGNGRFRAPRQFKAADFGESNPRLALADFDRDGRLDVAVNVEDRGKILLMRGKRRARLGAPRAVGVGDLPRGLLARRLNGDRKPDLAAAVALDGPGAGHISVLLKK